MTSSTDGEAPGGPVTYRQADCSSDGFHAYGVTEILRGGHGATLGWILGCPPATPLEADPALLAVRAITEHYGASTLSICWLYSRRVSEPDELRAHPDAVGTQNNAALRAMISAANAGVVCAWGALGEHGPGGPTRVGHVLAILRGAYAQTLHLGRLADGALTTPDGAGEGVLPLPLEIRDGAAAFVAQRPLRPPSSPRPPRSPR